MKVDVYALRPPTVTYPDRGQISVWRELSFAQTSGGPIRFRFFNLDGAFMDAGALQEMILPLAQGVRSGLYGAMALGVVTSDEAVSGFVTYLASEHQVPLYLSSSVDKFLETARPVGELTPGDEATLETIRSLGGSVTSARFAEATGLGSPAASNRLSSVEKKGFVFRLIRPRPEGDIFVDPRGPSADARDMVSFAEVDLPSEVRESVAEEASRSGRSPHELLHRAWVSYMEAHREEILADFEEVGRMMREEDTDGIRGYVSQGAAERAERSVERARRSRR